MLPGKVVPRQRRAAGERRVMREKTTGGRLPPTDAPHFRFTLFARARSSSYWQTPTRNSDSAVARVSVEPFFFFARKTTPNGFTSSFVVYVPASPLFFFVYFSLEQSITNRTVY
ncbi:unnamed protein product [Caenorhabditis auriculariae]|uniref:Transmembrane protein n=1 Tax=Caenorhabditis auriculariae TaxID=2777116 RepID=A0A8S1GW48_9PELO|nr:unnamed protein product [Caenorhabditis auriculariae]